MKTVIIGGGIAGLCTAWHLLKRANQDVVLLEAGTIGHATTSKAAGMVTPASEIHLGEDALMSVFARGSAAYPAFVRELTEGNPELVDFRSTGSLLCAVDQDGKAELTRLTDFQMSMGFKVRLLERRDVAKMEPALSHKIVLAALAPDEGCVDTLKLLAVLQRQLRSRGCVIREGASVEKFISVGNSLTGVVLRGGEAVKADQVVLTTGLGALPEGLEGRVKLPLRPVKGQALSVMCEPGTLSRPVRVSHRYPIYLVPREGGEIVIGATSEELPDDQVTAGGVMDLIYGAWQVLPQIYDHPIRRTWAGLRPATPDHKPVIGRAGFDNLYTLLGLYRHGIMVSPYLAGELVALMRGEMTSADWGEFSAERFK